MDENPEEKPTQRQTHMGNGDYREIHSNDESTYIERQYNNYSQIPATKFKKRDPIQKDLLDWVTTAIEKEILTSLHNRDYIVLDKEENKEIVQHTGLTNIKTGEKYSYKLYKNTPIEQIFNRSDIAGRLLILGAPGAGKTTILLKLAKQLVIRAKDNPQHPIPVILNLSSWKDDKQTIKDWIVIDLKAKYGVRPDIAKQWIEQKKIIPLLDGLDELDAARQEKCVKAINEFLKPAIWSRQIVIFSRFEEYQHYPTNLGLNSSIILKPLTTAQIQDYILKTEGENLWNKINADSDLMDFAKTPLFLIIIILSYQEIYFERWNQFKSSEKRRGYLFDAYIKRMLKRRYKEKDKEKSKPFKDEHTERWLRWLARQLIQENQTEFLIEKMQHTWLENRYQKNTYRWIFGTVIGVISGTILGVIIGVTVGVIHGMISGLIYGIALGIIFSVIYGLLYGLTQEGFKKIKAIESLNFSLNLTKINIIIGGFTGGLTGGLIGLIYGIFLWLISQKGDSILAGIIGGFIAGEIIVIIYGIIDQWKSSEIQYKNTPNQGIRRSLKNIAIFTAIAFIPCVLLFLLLTSELEESIPCINRLIGGLGFSLLFGILKSGLPVIQHISLRLVLWFNRYIPWNYARFLDYSTDRLFLQRVGGGYRFVHDLLRQHFAEKY
jgi:GTPase SAR1 family protein